MTRSVSSAEPQKLFRYSDVATRLDYELVSASYRLAAKLQHFEAACTEPNYRVSVAHLTEALRRYSRECENIDVWVKDVGKRFQIADWMWPGRRFFPCLPIEWLPVRSTLPISPVATLFSKLPVPDWMNRQLLSLPWLRWEQERAPTPAPTWPALLWLSRPAAVVSDLLDVLSPGRTDLRAFSRFVGVSRLNDWLRPFVRDARRRPWPRLRWAFHPATGYILEVISGADYSWKGFANASLHTLSSWMSWGAERIGIKPSRFVKGAPVAQAALTAPLLYVRLFGSETKRAELDQIEHYSTPDVDDIIGAWHRPSVRSLLKLIPGIKMLVDPPPAY